MKVTEQISQRRILLVDDDAAFRTRLAGALRTRGCLVAEAHTTANAIALAEGETFDGVVVDLRMPGASGLECVEALRKAWASMRIVVLTGFGSIATALQALRRGADDYLTKPSDGDTILSALDGIPSPLAERGKVPPPEFPTLDRVEWEHIQRTLGDCGGNISQAARVLGIDRRSLQRKLGKFPPSR